MMTHDVPVHIHRPDPPADGKLAWTEERIELLKTLRAEKKLSRRAIANEINSQTGSAFTKASICGKIDRIFPVVNPKLTEEQKRAHHKAASERWNAKKRAENRAGRIEAGLPVDGIANRSHRPNPNLRAVRSRPEDFTTNNVHGIAALENHHCRWILNDDLHSPVFCGLPKPRDTSWCQRHHQIVYQPVQARRAA